MQLTDLINELTKPHDTTIYKYAMGIGLILFLIGAILDHKGYEFQSAVSGIIGIATAITSMLMVIAVSNQTVTVDYDIQRDKNHIYINSHDDKMESVKLKIIGEDKQYIYVIRDNKTYKIPTISTKN